MTKEKTFERPPKGHVALLAYDSVNDRWQVVYVDALGTLQVRIVSSALPTLAATAANQATEITALQSLQNLVGALHDVGLDELDVNIDSSVNLNTQLYGWDGDSWEKLIVQEPANPNLMVGVAKGSSQLHLGFPNVDDRSVNYVGAIVLSHLYGYDGETWDRMRCEGNQLNINQHGWDGSAWHKQAMTWGYSDRWYEDLGTLSSNAGTWVANTTAVPAGEVWFLQALGARNRDRDPTYIMMFIHAAAAYFTFERQVTPGADIPVVIRGPAALKQGDYLELNVGGSTAGDVIEAGVWGYKMKVAE